MKDTVQKVTAAGATAIGARVLNAHFKREQLAAEYDARADAYQRAVDDYPAAVGEYKSIMKAKAQRNHADWCRQEIDHLKGEIARIAGLADDALIAEFAPEVARDAAIEKDIAENGPIEFDPLGRGVMAPKGVVVSKTPPPVRREGGDPAPVAPGLVSANGTPVAPNVVYTYDKHFNLVPVPVSQ
jgi:hypothetical protein